MKKNINKKGGFMHEGHGNRNDLIGEHNFGDLGQIILLIVFLAIWVLDSFVFKYSTTFLKIIPFYVHLPIAVFTFIIAFIITKISIKIVFGERRDPPAVITKGIFGCVRHPVYFSALLLYLGFVLTTLSVISFLFMFVIFLFYNFIASHEEKMLIEYFGADYKNYMKEVPKWIPKLKSLKK